MRKTNSGSRIDFFRILFFCALAIVLIAITLFPLLKQETPLALPPWYSDMDCTTGRDDEIDDTIFNSEIAATLVSYKYYEYENVKVADTTQKLTFERDSMVNFYSGKDTIQLKIAHETDTSYLFIATSTLGAAHYHLYNFKAKTDSIQHKVIYSIPDTVKGCGMDCMCKIPYTFFITQKKTKSLKKFSYWLIDPW